MQRDLRHKAALAGGLACDVAVTRAMVHARTRELTLLAGRPAEQVIQADYEQAKRELTGESDLDRQTARLDGPPGI
jgi:hypothetical protein